MGLDHDFLLRDREIDGEYLSPGYIRDPRAIHLHDDLVRYMEDTLAWIPTFNPARREPHRGLCMWGPTVIEAEGAAVAERVFRTWADLFAVGPPTLALTGGFSWAADEDRVLPPEAARATALVGGYDRLEFDREVVVGVLRQLADYARQVQSAGGRLYLLHQGV